MAQNILVTGGAGYIGTHTVLQLLLGGYKAVVIDNLDNSSAVAIKRVQELAGKNGPNLTFHKVRIYVYYVFVDMSVRGFDVKSLELMLKVWNFLVFSGFCALNFPNLTFPQGSYICVLSV
ncbi:hypothetical protein CsSME_00045214 [Camellia sinensis var. sinensis]